MLFRSNLFTEVTLPAQTPGRQASFTILNPGLREVDKTVILELINPSVGLQIGPINRTTITLLKGKPTLFIGTVKDPEIGSDSYDLVVPENFGTSRPLLEITRRGDREPSVSVDIEFGPGGFDGGLPARPGIDFQPVDQRVEFAPGETSRRIIVPIFDNGDVELKTRYFTVTMRNPSAGAGLFSDSSEFHSVLIGIMDNELSTYLDVMVPNTGRPVSDLEPDTGRTVSVLFEFREGVVRLMVEDHNHPIAG